MARSSATLKAVETDLPETDTLTYSELMGRLSQNYKEQLPIKAKLKPLEDEASEIKAKLLPMMLAQGLKKTSTKTETVSITEIDDVIVDDVTKMLAALKRDGFMHVIKLNKAQAKEYAQLKGKEIPGTHTEVVSRHIRVSAMK